MHKKLLESDWLEAVVNSLYSNPRHNKNKTEMLCSRGQICWSTTSIVAYQKVLWLCGSGMNEEVAFAAYKTIPCSAGGIRNILLARNKHFPVAVLYLLITCL